MLRRMKPSRRKESEQEATRPPRTGKNTHISAAPHHTRHFILFDDAIASDVAARQRRRLSRADMPKEASAQRRSRAMRLAISEVVSAMAARWRSVMMPYRVLNIASLSFSKCP